ncbi:hypothetical protein ACHAWF_011388, partial [Thalassiosira exigua]
SDAATTSTRDRSAAATRSSSAATAAAAGRRTRSDAPTTEEWYPRRDRAPYLGDVSDFGIAPHPHGHGGGGGGGGGGGPQHGDDHRRDDHRPGGPDGTPSGSGTVAPPSSSASSAAGSSPGSHVRSASLSNLSSHGPGMRRRSSFARAFWGGAIAEDSGGGGSGSGGGGGAGAGAGDDASPEEDGGADEGGGAPAAGAGSSSSARGAAASGRHLHFEDSETDPNSLLPPRFRRGSSVGIHDRRTSVDSTAPLRDRSGSLAAAHHRSLGPSDGPSSASGRASRVPRWALHDSSAVVMWDGRPVSAGALLRHRRLLSRPDRAVDDDPNVEHVLVPPTWRLRERMRTAGVCLALALNVGTDPPDLHRPAPCARVQTWFDPGSVSRAKARERIGERLEAQYARWQQRSKLKYRRALDPTAEAVRELCARMRETAGRERVLLHYNGHGVPRPTANGEIWLFDRHHTNYIPLGVGDLRGWLGKPSVVVLDCSGAGVLMPFFASSSSQGSDGGGGAGTAGANASATGAGTTTASAAPFPRSTSAGTASDSTPEPPYLRAVRDTLVLCPTARGEWLPLSPEFPADIFTSCLTTPIPMALRWFVRRTPLGSACRGLDPDAVADGVPGRLADRKTPLGELNWIFTAVTDTIAWNVLPGPLFQRLFRQDLLVASLFRNFLLADRILRGLNCTPSTHPELPSTCEHPLWQAWDLAVETCLARLVDAGHYDEVAKGGGGAAVAGKGDESGRTADGGAASAARRSPTRGTSASAGPSAAVPPASPRSAPEVNAPFFAEQLTAFEIWLEWAASKPRDRLAIRRPPVAAGGTPLPFLCPRREGAGADEDGPNSPAPPSPYELDPPQELPIVLQVLLSQAHRVRALVLLGRFLDLGPSAANLALSVGIFPYVLKLLQSPVDEYKQILVGIWSKVISFDPSCREDVVRDGALPHFVRHLRWGLENGPGGSVVGGGKVDVLKDAAEQRTMAAFILSVVCSGYPPGQDECVKEKLHVTCCELLRSLEGDEDDEMRSKAGNDLTPAFRMWVLICLGNLCKDNPAAQSELHRSGVHFRLLSRISEDDSPDVRTAACYALGCLIGSPPSAAPEGTPGEALVPPVPAMSSVPLLRRPSPQPQATGAPQALPSAFPRAAAVPGGLVPTMAGMNVISMNNPALAPTGLMGGLTALTGQDASLGPHIQPQLSVPTTASATSGLPGAIHGMPGMINLMPGNPPHSTMFGSILAAAASPPPVQSPPPGPRSVYDDRGRLSLDLSAAVALAKASADASAAVRFEAVLSLNRFVGKYIDAFVSVAGRHSGGQLQARNVLVGGSMPSIPMPEDLGGTDVEDQIAETWVKISTMHRSDPFPPVRELVYSIVVAINKRVMLEKTRLRQLRAGSRRRSLAGEEGGALSLHTPTLAGRRNATGTNLSSQDQGSPPPGMKRVVSAGTSQGAVSPRKQYNQTFPQLIDAPPVEEWFYPESKLFAWKRICFKRGPDTEILDPLSERGAMDRYRKTRNDTMRQRGLILKDSFSVLAVRPAPRMSRSPYDYDDGDAAAGVDGEADSKKRALHLHQVALLQNSGTRSTSLLRFHPYEPALVVCGGSDNISVWNAETSERKVAFSNDNPKHTRMTSALWVNEASASLLLTGSSDGTVKIFDVRLHSSYMFVRFLLWHSLQLAH